MNSDPISKSPSASHASRPRSPRLWLIGIAVILFLVFIVVASVLESEHFSDQLTVWLQGRLAEMTDGSVHLGRAHLRLIPTTLEMEDVQISPWLSSRKVSVHLSLWSMLTRSFIIKRLVLESPRIHLSSDTPLAGGFASEAEGGLERKVSPVIIRAVEMHQAHIHYEGRSPVSLIEMDQVEGTIKPDLFMRRFEYLVSAGRTLWRTDRFQIEVTELNSRGELRPERLNIKKLEVGFPGGSIYANGKIDLPESPSADLFVRAGIPLQSLEGTSVAGHPLSGHAHLQLQLTGPLDHPIVRGRAIFSRLSLGSAALGTVRTELAYQERELSLSALAGEVLSGKIAGEGKIVFPSAEYQLSVQLDAVNPRPLGEIVSQGSFPRDGHLSADLRLTGRGTRISALNGEGTLRIVQSGPPAVMLDGPGRPRSNGDPHGPFLTDLFRMMTLMDRGEVHYVVQAGTLQSLDAKMDLPQTHAAVKGAVSPNNLALEVEINSRRLGALLKPMWDIPADGSAAFKGTLTGSVSRPRVSGRLRWRQARWKGHAIGQLAAGLRYEEGVLRIEQGVVDQGEGRYDVSGKIKSFDRQPILDLLVSVRGADPSRVLVFFLPDFPLNTRARGTIALTGPWKQPRVRATLDLADGSLYEQPFDRGQVQLRIEDRSIRFSSLTLVKGSGRLEGTGRVGWNRSFQGEVRTEGIPVDQIRWVQTAVPELKGTLSGVISGEGSFDHPGLNYSLALDRGEWRGEEVGAASIQGRWEGSTLGFSVSSPARGIKGEGHVSIDHPYPYQLSLLLQEFSASPFLQDSLPKMFEKVSWKASGRLEAEGELKNLLQSRMRLRLTHFSADAAGYPIGNDGPIEIHLAEGRLRLEHLRLKGEETILNVSGGMTPLKDYDLFINGEAGLRLLGLLTEGLTYGKGKAYLVLKISDRWNDPKLRGGLTVQDGQMRSSRLAAPLKLTELSIFFNEKQVLLEALEAEMGKGRLSGSGKIEVERFAVSRFGFLLEMTNLRLLLLEGLSASVEGTFLYEGTPVRQELKGDIRIARALYDKRVDLKSWLLEFKSEGPAPRRVPAIPSFVNTTLNTGLNVHFYGKENIWIDNNVAKIPLEVDVLLRGSLDRPLVFGRVEAPHGTLRFRRNEFTITSAFVEFVNPERIDPLFDLKAKTEIRYRSTDHDIQLALVGSFDRFNLSLSSTPTLSDPDILALMTIGIPTEEIGQGGIAVGGEAVSFVVSEFLEEPIQKLGIDRFDVESTENEEGIPGTQVTIGKRMMEDRLKVTYSTTLDPSQEELVRLEYEINKNISLVGQRDKEGFGGDIIFRFEFH